ncbi:flagellar hook-length control protein FliK [Leifsonia sp. PS1209]|nr:flagellar hook-length control protein FliK [Leifsonia sp. PS1209]
MMTVHVTPDTLGPVTVRAHVGAEGVRVELFAPTDGGRDALRAILPDLRRDLSGAGLSGSLDLSSQNQPQTDDQRGGTADRQGNAPTASRAEQAGTAADRTPEQQRTARYGGAGHTIDLVV